MERENLEPESKINKLSEEQNVMQDEDRVNNLPSHLIGEQNATSLKFDSWNNEEMDSELPTFPNLTSLVLGCGYVGWEWLSQFLEKSPCLESLVFKLGYQIEHKRDKCYEGGSKGDKKALICHPPQNVPSCLRLNLKVIKFDDFKGDDAELKMVEYFLKNAEVLEKLIIRIEGADRCFDFGRVGLAAAEKQLEVTTKLLNFPRASKTCQIEFIVVPFESYFDFE